MIALLYFATAVALLFLADRFISPISRGAALALLLLPLIFTGRAVFTGGVYAPVELPYDVPPLAEHRAELRVPPDRNPMLTDIAFIIIPWREAVRRAVMEGQWPLLNRFELCGEPLAAAMQPAVYSPFTWIALLLPAAVSFTYTASIAFFIAALGTFVFARELARTDIASLLGVFPRIGWGFVAILAARAATVVVDCAAWYCLLPRAERPAFTVMLPLRWIAESALSRSCRIQPEPERVNAHTASASSRPSGRN